MRNAAVRLPNGLLEQLRVIARYQDRTDSSMLRYAVKRWFELEGKKLLEEASKG